MLACCRRDEPPSHFQLPGSEPSSVLLRVGLEWWLATSLSAAPSEMQRKEIARGGRLTPAETKPTAGATATNAMATKTAQPKGSKLTAEIDYQRAQAKKYAATGKPLLWDFDDLLTYAEGP